jgi:lambda family phage minor tail protein L
MIQGVAQDLSSLTRDALVELIEIDASSPKIGGGVLRFTNYQQTSGAPLVWKGLSYEPYPVILEEIEYVGKGVSSRPTLRVANLTGIFTALCIQYEDMLGAKVTRRRVLSKYLDGQPFANQAAGLPEDVWYIERKLSEDFETVSFELSSPMDLDNVMIPFMRVNASHCQVREYRGAECGYTATRLYDSDGTRILTNPNGSGVYELNDRGLYNASSAYYDGDFFYILYNTTRFYYMCIADAAVGTPLSNRTYFKPDVCGRRLSDCSIRFGEFVQLPFLAFPGTNKLPQ